MFTFRQIPFLEGMNPLYFLSYSLNNITFSCLNFCDEAWWFLSLRVFELLSSSLLLFPQRFGRYVLRPSSGVCWTREPTGTSNYALYWIHASKETIIWRMQVQSWLQASNNTGILNTCTQLCLTGIRTGDSRGFNKGHSSKFRVGSIVRQTWRIPEDLKMKTIVRKPLIIMWRGIKYYFRGREFIFRTCEVGADWRLIPRKISHS